MSRYTRTDSAWKAQRLRVLERDQWTCQYCHKHLEGSDSTVDHVEPIALDPERVYRDDELVAACRRCNGRKSDKALIRMDYHSPAWFTHTT